MQIVLAHVYKKRALNDNVGPYEASENSNKFHNIL